MGARRDEIIEAAARLLASNGIARVGRRDVAQALRLPTRAVANVVRSRSDLLRIVLETLPFPPVAESLQKRTQRAESPAMQALLTAAREVIGSPAAAWDTRELQAMALARYDRGLADQVQRRLDARHAAVLALVRDLRRSGGVDAAVDDEAAALHLMAVGLGLSMLAGASTTWSAPEGWDRLTARLVESLAAVDPPAVQAHEASVTWRARVTIPASPSALARLLRTIALLQVMVVSSFSSNATEADQVVDFILRAPPQLDRATLTQALGSVASEVLIARGAADDSQDVATRVLDRAAYLVEHPEATPQAVADLVLADSYEVLPASEGEDSSEQVLRVQWTLDTHVVLRRRGAPFTRIERHRASALLALVAALAQMQGLEGGFGWQEQLKDGTDVWIRLSRPEDVDGVAAMHARCSERSRYHRYFTPMNTWRELHLRRISGGHRGATLIATSDETGVIALGNVFPLGPEDASGAEIAVIVDDAFHGRGLGALMVDHLVEVARRLGFATLTAYVLGDNRPMIRLLEATSLDWEISHDHDLGTSVIAMKATL